MTRAEQLRQDKRVIRAFLRTQVWTEEKLCALLAHAEDKLSMWSCCCLIGSATAAHALVGRDYPFIFREGSTHYHTARQLPFAILAEAAFCHLGENKANEQFNPFGDQDGSEDLRRARIRPIIRAELRRRSQLAQQEATQQETVLSTV